MTGLEIELQHKIEVCENLHTELAKRPFELKEVNVDIVGYDDYPRLKDEMKQKLIDKERFLAKVCIEGERLWCIIIGMGDCCNLNYTGDIEEGEIFIGLLDNEPINPKLSFNDMIEFQSCDVLELKTL